MLAHLIARVAELERRLELLLSHVLAMEAELRRLDQKLRDLGQS